MPNTVPITKDDTACYWVFDPKHFSETVPSCLSLDMKVFFSSGNSADPYKMSVNSKKLCENYPKQIHDLGVVQAKSLTERNFKQDKEHEEIYAGYLKAEVHELEDIVYEDHYTIVEHAPIEDNHMHCNVVLKFPEDLKKPKTSKRNRITDRINQCFGEDIERP